MFARILIPTDFSAYADSVLAYLPDLKSAGWQSDIPFRETLALANEMDVSLIVLGSYRHSTVREMLAGSTLENVARLSRQPLLVVRPQWS